MKGKIFELLFFQIAVTKQFLFFYTFVEMNTKEITTDLDPHHLPELQRNVVLRSETFRRNVPTSIRHLLHRLTMPPIRSRNPPPPPQTIWTTCLK